MEGIATQGGMVKKRVVGGVGPIDPEDGLSLTDSVVVGAGIASGSVSRTQSCVFACDLTIPGSPSGLIHCQGATTLGSYVGFRAGGQFIARMGNGTVSAPTTPQANGAVLYLASHSVSGTGTLVYEFNVSSYTIRVWWNGVLIGTGTVASGSVTTWAGTVSGDYLGSTGNGPNGETLTALAATGASPLRYYENQLVA